MPYSSIRHSDCAYTNDSTRYEQRYDTQYPPLKTMTVHHCSQSACKPS